MQRPIDHIYIAATVAFTVYSQLIIRWQVSRAGSLPPGLAGKIHFVGHLFLNPWVVSGIAASLLAGVSWMLAMSRFEVSYAYPWVGLNFVVVTALGVLLFGESFGAAKAIGTLLVVAGVVVIARG